MNKWTDIDQDFPVAGQDNESQGFRDNFSATKEALEACETEIITLQDTTVKLDVRNSFGAESTLEAVKLVGHAEQTFRPGQAIVNSTGQELSYETGSYHSLILGNAPGDSVTLDITGFPIPAGTEDGRFARIRVDAILGQSITTPKTLNFANSNGDIYYDGQWPETLTVTSQTNPVAVEFWSYDGGVNIYAKYLGVFTLNNTARNATFENVTMNGNLVVGNSLTDTATFHAVPQIPTVTALTLPSIANSKVGMMVYNIETNNLVACKRKSTIIDATAAVKGQRYAIVEVGSTNFTTIGSADSVIGTVFDATWTGVLNPATGTGKVAEIEWVTIG